MDDWTGYITAGSTGTLAVIAVVSLIVRGVSKRIDSRKKERWERDELSRVEIVNIRCHGFEGPGGGFGQKMMTIRVRNRSHLPVTMDEPVFQIRVVKSVVRTREERQTDEEPTNLGPGEVADFHRHFSWPEFLDDFKKESPRKFDIDRLIAYLEKVALEECTIVDLGSRGA